MMIFENMEKWATLPVKDVTHSLIEVYYPQLFLVLDSLGEQIRNLGTEFDFNLGLSIHVKMNEELEELFRKEKVVLLPYLQQLETEQKKSEGCKPFKNVKNHYTNLLARSRELQSLTEELQLQEHSASDLLKYIKKQVLQFEEALINVQYCKEKYLFRRFRSCTGNCKSI